jgi:hypothetical protein
VKSASILLTGYQPPVLIEVGVPLFGLTVVALGSTAPRDVRGIAARLLGAVAVSAGVLAVVLEAVGGPWDPALAIAMVAVLVGSVTVGRRTPPLVATPYGVALLLGLLTVPALFVGGLLGLVHERLLELPLLLLAGAWGWLGVLMVRAAGTARDEDHGLT